MTDGHVMSHTDIAGCAWLVPMPGELCGRFGSYSSVRTGPATHFRGNDALMPRKIKSAAIALIILLPLLCGAKGCTADQPPPTNGKPADHNPARDAFAPMEVLIQVVYLAAQRQSYLPIEVAYTTPDGTQSIYIRNPYKDGTWELHYTLLPGQRISVTADQDEKGYLHCMIKENDVKVVAWERRNDPGSVHCEHTNPKRERM